MRVSKRAGVALLATAALAGSATTGSAAKLAEGLLMFTIAPGAKARPLMTLAAFMAVNPG